MCTELTRCEMCSNFDLAKDPGSIVSAVCHGPAALVYIELPSGRHMLEGHPVTRYSNDENGFPLVSMLPSASRMS
jgi:hypothetical protein